MHFGRQITRRQMLAMALAYCAIDTALAEDVADFYRGKTITIIVGLDPGGSYDLYARILARHIGHYIPGNPTIIVQNMPGAGSVIAANHLYNVAPQDGTVILAPDRNAGLAPIMGQQQARYDPSKINWLGSLNSDVGVMQVWGNYSVKTIEDARKTEVIIGSTTPLTDSEEYPALLNNTLGTRFKLVRGYASMGAVQNALERGEIQGLENSFSTMVQRFPDWRNKMSLLVQLSLNKHPQLPDVPLVFDYIKPEFVAGGLSVEDVQSLWRIILTQQVIGRPFAVGPGVPPERIAALRQAFKLAVQDPSLKADTAESNLELFPLDGSDLQGKIASVAAASRSVVARLRELILYKGE